MGNGKSVLRRNGQMPGSAGPFRLDRTIGEFEKYCFHYVCSFSGLMFFP